MAILVFWRPRLHLYVVVRAMCRAAGRSSGVTVARASARLARECGARRGHFNPAYAIAWPVPGHRHRLRRGPRLGFPGPRVELSTLAGRADKLGAVTIGQRPGHERPRLVAAGDPPPHLERRPARPAADREHPHIERTHENPSPEATGTSRFQPITRGIPVPRASSAASAHGGRRESSCHARRDPVAARNSELSRRSWARADGVQAVSASV